MVYISGWQALNLPNASGFTADWHPAHYFDGFHKPLKLYEVRKSPLGELGIETRHIAYLDKKYPIASFARAIADLVWLGETAQLKGCVNDFLSDNDARELFEYLKIINKHKNVEDFIKTELTKLYFEDKRSA